MSEISIREYEQKLQRLADAAPSREALQQAVAVGKGLLSTLRSWGTPPVQQQTLKQKAQSLKPIIDDQPHARAAHLVRPAEPVRRMPGTWHNARVEKAAAGSPLPPPKPPQHRAPDGYMSREELLELVGRKNTWLNHQLDQGKFPAPEHRSGTRKFWRRQTVMAWLANNPAPSLPEGDYVRTAEVLGILQRGRSWLARAIAGGGFPRAEHTVHHENFWRRATVEAWKAAHPVRSARGPRKQYVMPEMHGPGPQPQDTYTIAQVTRICGRTQPWVYQQMRLELPGYRPFPRPLAQRWGRVALWDSRAVDAWIDWRNNQAPQRAGMRPLRSI